ncbi:MAG: helix-turn-helix transcriptional regulator [Nitrospiria bacterium]
MEHQSGEVGVILVGKDGQPLKMNPAAEAALNGREIAAIPEPGISAAPAFFNNGKVFYSVKTGAILWDAMEKIVFLEPLPPKRMLDAGLSAFPLSKRQREVAAWVIRGLSNQDIAERLFITEQTVKDHLRRIYEITGIHKRGQLSAKVMGLSE